LKLGAWSLALGAWSLAPGAWSLELGAYGSVLELQKLRLVDNAKSRCFFTKKWY
jgi:hypothetical protein